MKIKKQARKHAKVEVLKLNNKLERVLETAICVQDHTWAVGGGG